MFGYTWGAEGNKRAENKKLNKGTERKFQIKFYPSKTQNGKSSISYSMQPRRRKGLIVIKKNSKSSYKVYVCRYICTYHRFFIELERIDIYLHIKLKKNRILIIRFLWTFVFFFAKKR